MCATMIFFFFAQTHCVNELLITFIFVASMHSRYLIQMGAPAPGAPMLRSYATEKTQKNQDSFVAMLWANPDS